MPPPQQLIDSNFLNAGMAEQARLQEETELKQKMNQSNLDNTDQPELEQDNTL